MKQRALFTLAILFAVNTLNFFDRQVLGAVGESIRREFGLGDTALGALGTAFTLLYAMVGVPFGRMADGVARKPIIAAGVFVWSVLTAASGLAQNFWQLFVLRLGIGVGEATCAPAAASIIGDLFPASRRSWALSIFMLGVPIGFGLSYAISGAVAQAWGWRSAFFVAGVPGLLCALAALWMYEPPRGMAEGTSVDAGTRRRAGSPYRTVLSSPTMWWLIASGALQNFTMYALMSFLSPFLIRYHGVTLQQAGLISMLVYGFSGVPGLIVGGMAADAAFRRRHSGRLIVGAAAIAMAAPVMYAALSRPQADVVAFSVLMGIAVMFMYAYYSSVYATIQDVIEPSLRGTAMALYFFAMYMLGGSMGPVGTGLISDFFTVRAATAAGVLDRTAVALEPFRASGLHSAMLLLPILVATLAGVLFAASRTVTVEVDGLRAWMRESAGEGNR
jgi:predicted MFS family arabinose efflux permease